MQFNAPSWYGPQDYSYIPQTIDNLFNSFVRARAAQQMQSRQDAEDVLKYGFPLRELSNLTSKGSEWATRPPIMASQPPTINTQPNGPDFIGPQQPVEMIGPKSPIRIGQAPDQVAGRYGDALYRQRMIQDASLREVNATARQKEASANWSERRPMTGPGGTTQLSQEQEDAVKWGISNGLAAPEDLSARGPRSQVIADGLMGRQDFQDWYKSQTPGSVSLPNFNPTSAAAGRAGARAGETFRQGGGAQSKVSVAKALLPQLEVLRGLNDKMNRSDFQVINKIGIEAAAQGGNELAQQMLTQTNLIADQAQAMLGVGSDAKLAMIQKLLSAGQTKEQLSNAIDLTQLDFVNRAHSFEGKKFYGSIEDAKKENPDYFPKHGGAGTSSREQKLEALRKKIGGL